MIRTAFILTSLLLSLFPAVQLKAQYITFNIEVEPEISVEVERQLDFGQLLALDGVKQILPGDENMGIFTIRALRGQEVYARILSPDSLTHTLEGIDDTIPVDLSFAFSIGDEPRFDNALPLSEEYTRIATDKNLSGNLAAKVNRNEWVSIYIYVYGELFLNDVQEGTYTGYIDLIVEY